LLSLEAALRYLNDELKHPIARPTLYAKNRTGAAPKVDHYAGGEIRYRRSDLINRELYGLGWIPLTRRYAVPIVRVDKPTCSLHLAALGMAISP
jgi:hypothetical protein